jgi:alpha-N-arabinofuranosidase
MANYAQTVNVIGCIKTTKTASALETTGQVLKLYRQHFGVVPVEITGTPEPLNVSAAWTEDRSAITIAVVNPLREKSILSFDIKGAALTSEGTLWLITGADEKAYNEPGKEPAVPITETVVKGVKQLDLPPLSISLWRLSVKK